jgi:hypothetical protein
MVTVWHGLLTPKKGIMSHGARRWKRIIGLSGVARLARTNYAPLNQERNNMPLARGIFDQVILASAHSESPLTEDTLREIAEVWNSDPDVVVERHDELRDDWQRMKKDRGGAMPLIIP